MLVFLRAVPRSHSLLRWSLVLSMVMGIGPRLVLADEPKGKAPPTTAPVSMKDASQEQVKPKVELKPGESPKIKFESLEYQFPKTPVGRDVYHEFVFTNEGNGPLEIVAVKPSCGCTTAGDYEKIIAPGGKGKIPLRVATTNFTGYINKTVTVITNMAPPESTVTLAVKGDVWEPLACVPKTIGFGRIAVQDPKGVASVQKVTIGNNSTTPAKLANVRCTNPSFKGEIKELEPGKKFELHAMLVPPFQGGVVNGTFEIDTGVPEMPKLELPVSVYLAAELEVFPSRLPLPAMRSNDLQRRFSIVNNSQKPVKLDNVVCSNTALKARIQEVRPGMSYTLLVDIPKSYVIRPGGDVISVKTDSTTTPRVSMLITEAKMTGSAFGAPVDLGPGPGPEGPMPGEFPPGVPPPK